MWSHVVRSLTDALIQSGAPHSASQTACRGGRRTTRREEKEQEEEEESCWYACNLGRHRGYEDKRSSRCSLLPLPHDDPFLSAAVAEGSGVTPPAPAAMCQTYPCRDGRRRRGRNTFGSAGEPLAVTPRYRQISTRLRQNGKQFWNHIQNPRKTDLEANWKQTGTRLEVDWKQTGARLEADWKQIGSTLEAYRNQIGSRLAAD